MRPQLATDLFFSDLAAHQALGRVVENIGKAVFWRKLILLLNHVTRFDNALVAFFPGVRQPPMALEEFDEVGQTLPSPVWQYTDGLYLLDPVWQGLQTGMTDGLYRLEEIAPDQFRQSEFYLSYFRDVVGEDELEIIINVAPGQVFVVSLGAGYRFESAAIGRVQACLPWLIPLVRQHWQADKKNIQGRALPLAKENMADRVELALGNFGAKGLSEREVSIARQVLRGYSSKAIAQDLGISLETVKVHRRNLYNKLGIASQPELFALFLKAVTGKEAAG